jgi:hypothetical protein
MGTSLAYHDALNRSAASRARFTGLLVNTKVILEVTTSVNPVDTSTVASDALIQHLTNAAVQQLCLFKRQVVGNHLGVQASPMQSFICIDIPQTSDEVLIH